MSCWGGDAVFSEAKNTARIQKNSSGELSRIPRELLQKIAADTKNGK